MLRECGFSSRNLWPHLCVVPVDMTILTHLPHAEPQVSVLGLEFAVVGLDEHALVAPRRLPRVQPLRLVLLGVNSIALLKCQ